ncbi:MAG: NifU family protein [Alphaproteobacteria bacterium]|nr:NifU family protein [Alphaproteobacteria bacterium]
MMIELQKLSNTQNLIFFSTPLPIVGCYLHKDSSSHPIIENLEQTSLAKTLLLTSDFLYIESVSDKELDDLTSIAFAEIDEYPLSSPQNIASSENIEQKIILLLNTIVAPFLKKDGGDIKFEAYQNNTVFVKFLGKCNGCPYATKTLKEKVEKNLIRYIPEIRKAELV